MRRLAALLVLLAVGWATPEASAAGLSAGAGKADITPRTGYYLRRVPARSDQRRVAGRAAVRCGRRVRDDH